MSLRWRWLWVRGIRRRVHEFMLALAVGKRDFDALD